MRAMPKPLVAVACLCEKILQEKDNVLSAIRMIDTVFVEQVPQNLPEGMKAGFQMSALISLKSGAVTGEQQIAITLRTPSGEKRSVGEWDVVFNGGEHGVNFTVSLLMSGSEFGLFWLDVIWRNEVLTSVPIKVAERAREPETH